MVRLQTLLEEATGVKVDLRTPEAPHPRIRGKVPAETALL